VLCWFSVEFLTSGNTCSDNEAGSSKINETREMVFEDLNSGNTVGSMSFGFINIDFVGEEKPHYLLGMKILAADSILK
jgi:hypothetical protein